MSEQSKFRLPTSIRPVHYDLELNLNFEDLTFTGLVFIELDVQEPTSEIALNVKELNVTSAFVHQRFSLSDIEVQDIKTDVKYERVTLTPNKPLKSGTATLSMAFHGAINNRMRGLYRIAYNLPDGAKRIGAATQFEPIDARSVFPCFDEPAFKATFKLTVIVPKDRMVLSNTAIVSETEGETKKKVRFAKTPVMSTYLLAFAVGDFESIEARTKDGVTVRVWTIPGKVEQGRFSLNVATKSLEYYTDYFGIAYPLEKLDLLALPDFQAGAMENWGLITFRETALLFDPKQSSLTVKIYKAYVVAHENSHQWFGNLVTMDDFSYLWLNESFATMMGWIATDAMFPEWDVWTQFLVRESIPALGLDSLKSSHPIEVEVEDPSKIDQIFDLISYNKGASILRMLENFLGAGVFRHGIHNYLQRHAYGNATTQDLWESLSEVSGQPVAEIMDGWIKQTGYPVIHVNRLPNNKVNLSQERFLIDRHPSAPVKNRTPWRVPLKVMVESGEVQTVLLDRRKLSLTLPENWVKFNTGQHGFYRVNYEPEDWIRLSSEVEGLNLPPADRLGLQNDAYALMQAGYMPSPQYLEFTSAYRAEQDFSVWAEVAGNISSLASIFADEPYYSDFAKWARELFQPIVQKLGWDPSPDEKELDTLLRPVVLGALAKVGDDEVIAEAQKRFEAARQDLNALHPNLRSVVFAAVALSGDGDTFEALLELERKADFSEEKGRLLSALGQFKKPALIIRALEYGLSPNVREQDVIYVLRGLAVNHGAKETVWEFLRQNWDEIHKRFGDNRYISDFISAGAVNFVTESRADEVEAFFKEHPVPMATMAIAQRVEAIRAKAKFLSRNRRVLSDWFSKYV